MLQLLTTLIMHAIHYIVNCLFYGYCEVTNQLTSQVWLNLSPVVFLQVVMVLHTLQTCAFCKHVTCRSCRSCRYLGNHPGHTSPENQLHTDALDQCVVAQVDMSMLQIDYRSNKQISTSLHQFSHYIIARSYVYCSWYKIITSCAVLPMM